MRVLDCFQIGLKRFVHLCGQSQSGFAGRDLLLDTTARDSVKMREAAGNHQSNFDYAPKSPIAADMAAIGDEILKRMKGMNHGRKAA